jgi:hypothetical protein
MQVAAVEALMLEAITQELVVLRAALVAVAMVGQMVAPVVERVALI